jgi:peptidyl-tRNA hydrolase, PTH1 family
VLKKPAPDQREALERAIERAVRALPELLTERMEQATAAIHTSKPPRPKPPKPASTVES